MSNVSNVILCYSCTDRYYIKDDKRGMIQHINDFFDKEGVKGLVSVDDNHILPKGWYGGTKYLETEILIGSFNYLRERVFIDHLASLDWKIPDCVQLIIKREHGYKFEFVNIFEEK